jgi:glycosyltransferase involved in cell wall biosynthesis
MRTQGTRPVPLAEVLAGLAEQTDRDFEVELVRHRADEDGRQRVDEVLARTPEWLRGRTRVHDLDTGARGAPLNVGWTAARGSYVVVLDDDDLVLPHWVATFRDLSEQGPGRALRAAALLQRVEPITVDGQLRAAPLEEPHRHWPERFQLLEHLLVNHTPCMSIAFPRSVFHDLGERYAEDLATTEDWDFLMRAVSWAGVIDSQEATSVYRWWQSDESSRHLHDDAAWQDNHRVVQDRLDERVLLMPPGSVTELRTMIAERDQRVDELSAERDREAANAQQLLGEARDYLARLDAAEERIRQQRGKIQRLRARLSE